MTFYNDVQQHSFSFQLLSHVQSASCVITTVRVTFTSHCFSYVKTPKNTKNAKSEFTNEKTTTKWSEAHKKKTSETESQLNENKKWIKRINRDRSDQQKVNENRTEFIFCVYSCRFKADCLNIQYEQEDVRRWKRMFDWGRRSK